MKKIKILELFGGIGACTKALNNLGIDYEIADYVEIDKYAVASFNAIHNTSFIPQDICKWNKDIEVDLIMHGSPCQDFSLAGKQAGGDENSGTRSSLMYETLRIVEKLKPKYVIWENVKNVISNKHIHNFNNYINKMESLGYKNYYQVLNAKDYGIPQNRERVFTISILGEETFVFPEKQKLKIKLRDLLEDNVDEEYYLSDKMLKYITSKDDKYKVNENKLVINRDIACSKTTREGNTRADTTDYICDELPENYNIKNGCKQIYDLNYYNHEQSNRVYDPNYSSPTLRTKCDDAGAIKIEEVNDNETIGTIQAGYPVTNHGHRLITNNLRIRKLTPKECFRLMGFDDEDFENASKVCSNSQLYKQAGNSIVVNVLEAILKELLIEK
jgi:DNA (cytosine-5)-methyltransferase 1